MLTLAAGLAMSLSYSPHRQIKVLKHFQKDWQKINKERLRNEISGLYRSKLVNFKNNSDGSMSLVLTEKGKLKILKFNLDKMEIKKGVWDKKWRLIIFDIP
ncbi:MAG: hypothetical protein LiPW39_77, partial [Parcubacteria group bacterium LiPW_39]